MSRVMEDVLISKCFRILYEGEEMTTEEISKLDDRITELKQKSRTTAIEHENVCSIILYA